MTRMGKNKAIFLDRDGTINIDYGYVHEKEKLKFIDGAIDALYLLQSKGYLLIIITNQSGVGRKMYSLKVAEIFRNYFLDELKIKGVKINGYYSCYHSPEEHCICRKPSPFLINKACTNLNIDKSKSFMIGDKDSDIKCGENADVESLKISDKKNLLYWAKKIIRMDNEKFINK